MAVMRKEKNFARFRRYSGQGAEIEYDAAWVIPDTAYALLSQNERR
jgi:hypothetical protein